MSRSKELKIASLLPSSTEICVVLGLTDQLVGRSHECDFPPEIHPLPVLTRATVDSTASSREIDRQVRSQLSEGLSLYQVEEERLRDLAPDVVPTSRCWLPADSAWTKRAGSFPSCWRTRNFDS